MISRSLAAVTRALTLSLMVPGLLLPAATALARVEGVAGAAFHVSNAATDSMLVLVELRDRALIERELEQTAEQRSAAESRQEQAKLMQARAAALIKIKAAEVKALAAQVDLAKADKNEALKKEFEGQKKFAELEKKLLERREKLRQEEIDLAKAEFEFLKASEARLEQELDLAGLRASRSRFTAQVYKPEVAAEMSKLEAEIRESQGKTLAAAVAAAKKRKQVADREVDLSKAREQVFKMQLKLLKAADAGR
jgi:hypothetical protein